MLDFADVKPSVLNALIITLTVVVTLTALKFILAKWHVPGLSEVVLAT